jgi:hypothetical protein
MLQDNLSRHYRKMNRATKDASLGSAPAYHTRRQDGVFYPTMDTFNNAYNTSDAAYHPKRNCLLNAYRAIWTNNKAYITNQEEETTPIVTTATRLKPLNI